MVLLTVAKYWFGWYWFMIPSITGDDDADIDYFYWMVILMTDTEYRFGWNLKCYMSLSNPPYPTAQTTYSRVMKFGMESQWGNTFGAIRGFFQFSPLSGHMRVGWGSPWGLKNHKNFFLDFSTLGGYPTPPPYLCSVTEIEKTSDGPKSIPPLTFHTKFNVSTVDGLGCRVWWVR